MGESMAEFFAKCDRLLRKVYDEEDATRWMITGHPELDGRTPMYAAQMGQAAKVLRIIDGLVSGAYQ